MAFWRKHKSKILIGSVLLAIAAGALTILKSEEARLKREIVGCERVIEKETRNVSPQEPERREELQQVINQRETLQEEKQEVEVTETELQQVIEDIQSLEDYDIEGEKRMVEAEYRGIDKPLELINILERFRDEALQELVEYYKKLNKYNDPYNTDKRNKPEIPQSIQELIPDDPRIKMYFENFIKKSELRNPDYDQFLKVLYKWAINEFQKTIDGKEYRVTFLNDKVKEVSFKVLKIIKSGKFGKEVEKYTQRVNEVNETIDTNIGANQKFIEYTKAKIEDIKRRAKKGGIILE